MSSKKLYSCYFAGAVLPRPQRACRQAGACLASGCSRSKLYTRNAKGQPSASVAVQGSLFHGALVTTEMRLSVNLKAQGDRYAADTLTALLHLFKNKTKRIRGGDPHSAVSGRAGKLSNPEWERAQSGEVTHLYLTNAALPMAAIVRGSHNIVAANTTLNARSPLCGGDSKCIVSPEKSYLLPPAGTPALTAAAWGAAPKEGHHNILRKVHLRRQCSALLPKWLLLTKSALRR